MAWQGFYALLFVLVPANRRRANFSKCGHDFDLTFQVLLHLVLLVLLRKSHVFLVVISRNYDLCDRELGWQAAQSSRCWIHPEQGEVAGVSVRLASVLSEVGIWLTASSHVDLSALPHMRALAPLAQPRHG